MASVVDKYYRKIEGTIDNVKNRMNIASLLVKQKEVDLKIDKINENLDLVNTNKNNIDKNKNEIYHKGLLITSNNNSIYGHKKWLDIIENDIVTINSNIKDVPNVKTLLDRLSSMQDIIKTNTLNITNNYNISQINKKKSEYNLDHINIHTNNIKTINSSITDIKNDIDQINSNIYAPNSTLKYVLNEIYLFNPDFIKELNFKSDTKELLVYEIAIEDNFIKDSYIELYESILYLFD